MTNLVVEYYHQISGHSPIGDIVLVSAENSPRNSWPLGRVVEVFADKKGLVRRTRVKVKGAVLERPIDKLCLLIEA